MQRNVSESDEALHRAASLTAVIPLHRQLSGMNKLKFGAQVIHRSQSAPNSTWVLAQLDPNLDPKEWMLPMDAFKRQLPTLLLSLQPVFAVAAASDCDLNR